MEPKILENIINSPKDYPNKELEKSLNFLSNNFDETKEKIITLTKILDFTEMSYNKILDEYKSRKT